MGKQLEHVLVRLREMILDGELQPGERVVETAIAQNLNVSRTPVRQALPVLEQEGLLAISATRGYHVRSFRIEDVYEAVALRGTIEGHAARLAAERGVPPDILRRLKTCLEEGNAILGKGHLEDADIPRYSSMNGRFHALVIEAADNGIVETTLAFVNHVPFAAANALAFDRGSARKAHETFSYGHRQHHMIVDALEAREGARVEALMREHTYPVRESIALLQGGFEIVEAYSPGQGRPDRKRRGLAAAARRISAGG